MTAPARFKQSDVTRILRGARAAGFGRVRMNIDAAGNIVVDVANDPGEPGPERINPLDRLLRRP